MKASQIREKFLNYFEKQQHTRVSSSSLIPENDATLIFANAGMNQFKNTFLGLEKRNYVRATSSQKCVRAGGKHNDLENVGHTARHHTFFEMLGNFSFGDYFKKEAIHFAWEFLTKELGIDKNRLFVTVFLEDDEAADIWHKEIGVPKEKIFRFGEKDNFWRMGDTGPCGPCSEIFFDHDPKKPAPKNEKEFENYSENDRLVEIWNLVFMQYMEEPKGTLTPLPKPSVDTGSGLERLAAVMQNTYINYETDMFLELISSAEQLSGIKKDSSTEITAAYRVLSDHARCASFLISDGVLPSNDGRGYVLRRILRRAIRYGRTISKQVSFLPHMAQTVIDQMNSVYPALKQQEKLIITTVKTEEERFLATLDQGTQILDKALAQLKQNSGSILDGPTVFKLYDTYGFPVDLTRLISKEQNIQIDEQGFEKEMNAAKEKARASWKGSALQTDERQLIEISQKIGATQFTGYKQTESHAKILALSDGNQECDKISEGQKAILFTDETCFYAESGGQIGDKGSFSTNDCNGIVLDCTKINSTFVHHIKVIEGDLALIEKIHLKVDRSERRQIMANHSATHLMHSALKKVLGDHITQAGSLVEADRLRFDFTHNQPLSTKEIQKVEDSVNYEINQARSVNSKIMKYDDAIASGVTALFGEKYGDEVRVIDMGEFSKELCGGTHVTNTAQIRMFKLVSESGVSAGVRRVEAITGEVALKYLMQSSRETLEARKKMGAQETWLQYMEQETSTTGAYIEQQKEQIKALDKEIKKLKISNIDYDKILKQSENIATTRFLYAQMPVDDRKVLTEICERLQDKLNGIVIIFGEASNHFPLLVNVADNISKSFPAGNLLKRITNITGGKGGGRPQFAQGAADSLEQLEKAMEEVRKELQK